MVKILIKQNKVWLGNGFSNGNAFFTIPSQYAREWADGVYDSSTGLVKFRNVGWYTNLDFSKRHETLTLYRRYLPTEYSNYDNYDAINVDKVSNIPCDYCESWEVTEEEFKNLSADEWEITREGEFDGEQSFFIILLLSGSKFLILKGLISIPLHLY